MSIETYLSRKTQLILTKKQKNIINEMIYIRNKAWNKLVEIYNPVVIQKIQEKRAGKKVGKILPSLKELEQFLHSQFMCNHRLLRTCIQDYLRAWERCFNKIGRKPKFHSLKQSELRVNFADCKTKIIYLKGKGYVFGLSLPQGITAGKYIKFHENMSDYAGKEIPIYSIIRRNNKYYISLTFKLNINQVQSQNNQIGLDWGLKHFFTDSNGNEYDLPDSLIRQEMRIKTLQKHLSKKRQGSKNWNKLKIKLNRAWLRYTNIRKDYIEKLSYRLLSENNIVVLEDLDIQGMVNQAPHSTRRKNIYKNSFGIFRDRIVQKSARFTCEVRFVNRRFPSSKMCCKCKRLHYMPVSKRTMVCECGNAIDRDLNAAINILNEGLR